MSGHTKGPWTITENYRTIRGEGKTQYLVAYIAPASVGESEADANARLIAAAPSMYDIIKLILDDCSDGCGPAIGTLDKAIDLLAKIDGAA